MATGPLALYLNDHLAGAVAAIDLLATLETLLPDPAERQAIKALHDEVAEDRDELEALMTALGVARSLTRRAGGWVAAKLAELKLVVDDPRASGLRVFEMLEGVALGIDGKRALWAALAAAATTPALKRADYSRLLARADRQRAAVEPLRLAAARRALLLAGDA
jgi:hypothetical protein